MTTLEITSDWNITSGKLKQRWAILTDDEGITMTRQTMKNCWSLLWLAAIFASAYPGVLTAQAEEAPVTSMEAGGGASQAARQAASMTEMMGAPGLVPFDIMTGQAGKWMVG